MVERIDRKALPPFVHARHRHCNVLIVSGPISGAVPRSVLISSSTLRTIELISCTAFFDDNSAANHKVKPTMGQRFTSRAIPIASGDEWVVRGERNCEQQNYGARLWINRPFCETI
jgi:hypothetical protein